MLTGKELGAAIESAIQKKGITKKALAKAFEVAPPSVSDWVKRGTISKDKLPELFRLFSDVVGPAHWGLDAPLGLEQPRAHYKTGRVDIGPRPDPRIAEVVRLMEETDDAGRHMALGAVKGALAGHRPAKANRRS
jgi:hypothetical protein